MKDFKILFLWILFFITWELVCIFFGIPEYFVPVPSKIFYTLFSGIGFYLSHFMITLQEALLGLIIGSLLGFFLAISVSFSSVLSPLISSFCVSIQSFPKIVLAPIIIAIFGFGLLPKIFFSALLCFFPVFISTLAGINNLQQDIKEFVELYKPSRWDYVRKITVPSSMGGFVTGLKTSSPLAVAGAVIGEWFMAEGGLSYLVIVYGNLLDMDKTFSAVFLLGFMAFSFYYISCFIEKILIRRGIL